MLAIYFKTSVKKTDKTVSTQTEQSPPYWETGSDETPTNVTLRTLSDLSIPQNWQSYSNSAYGFSLSHPLDTEVRELTPGTGEKCTESAGGCITEEKIFLATINRTDPGPRVHPTEDHGDYVLSFKVVEKPRNRDGREIADYFVQGCEATLSPVEEIRVQEQISGFIYTCLGTGPVTYLWVPFKDGSTMVFGAGWFGDTNSDALARQILSTIQFH